MRDRPLMQTGLYLVVIGNMTALCGASTAESTPSAVPTPSVEVPPGRPSKGESEPSQEQAPAPGAALHGVSGEGQIFQMDLGYAF